MTKDTKKENLNEIGEVCREKEKKLANVHSFEISVAVRDEMFVVVFIVDDDNKIMHLQTYDLFDYQLCSQNF